MLGTSVWCCTAGAPAQAAFDHLAANSWHAEVVACPGCQDNRNPPPLIGLGWSIVMGRMRTDVHSMQRSNLGLGNEHDPYNPSGPTVLVLPKQVEHGTTTDHVSP